MKQLAILLVLCLFLPGCGKAEPAPAGTFPAVICEDPVYTVEIYQYMGGLLSGPLYLATVDAPDSILETSEKIHGEQSVPIFQFTTIGDSEDLEKCFWLLDVYDGGIVKTYHVVDRHSSYGSTTAQAGYLNSLAKKTSEETPLYIVGSGGFNYMVIGDTAYCPNPWAPEAVPEALPELNLEEKAVKVIKIE